MRVDIVRMYFNCKCGQFNDLFRNEVTITADLEKNDYIFKAKCPVCGQWCENSRRMN